MAQIQSLASAFNPGHDLWIVPEPQYSRWTLRLDWYLNFQITRAGRHEHAIRGPVVDGILKEIEWNPAVPAVGETSPLLVACEGRLPARWVVMVPGAGNLIAWTGHIDRLWRNLQQPTMKVFLPTGLQAGPFSEELRKKVPNDEYSLVLDQDPVNQ